MANLNDAILNDTIESSEALSKNFTRIAKEYDLALHEAKEFYKRKGQLIAESNLAELKANAKNAKLTAAERAKYAEQAVAVERQIEERAAKSMVAFKQALYTKFNQAEKVDYQKSLQAKEQEFRKSEDAKYKLKWAKAKAEGASAGQLAAITKKHNEENRKSIKREIEARKQQAKEEIKLSQQIQKENLKSEQAKKDAIKATGKEAIATLKNQDSSVKDKLKSVGKAAGAALGIVSEMGKVSLKDIMANKAAASKENAQAADAKVADIQSQMAALDGDNSKEAEELREQLAQELAEATKEAITANNKATIDQMKSMAVGAISDAYDQAFSAAENTMKSYQSHIDARLQGSDKSWKKANNLITSNLGLSTLVKTTNVIEQLKTAVDQGISYNVEQRAFLNEISDKIANTFDAFDASLLRLVKLQQADSTAARLGMEAMLTKFLNSTFEDSSYLTNLADSVAGAIVDASSQLTNAQAAEFDYIVHKWLGSLSAVGISDDAVNTIAQGINYLATGDVQNLASNTQMTTMFAMAASRANLEYSELLLNGLDADKTNRLLEGMLSYLADIAKGTDNQVVKAAYGDVLNLSLSDFKAIENLSSSISSITSNTASYASMLSETDSQLNSLKWKVSLSEQLSNIYDNAIYSVATDMVNNPVTWATQKMLNFMDKNQMDINIPFINAMGFGVDLNTSVKGLMRVGMGLAQGFSFMGTLLSGLSSQGGTNLDAWGAKETTSRGSGMSLSTSTSLGDTSSSVYVTNTNESDVKNSTLNQAADDAEETKKITNKNTKSEKTFDDFYKATIGSSASEWIVTHERHLAEVFRPSSTYLHTRDERMDFINEGEKAVRYLASHDPIAYSLLLNSILPEEQVINKSTSGIDTNIGNVITGTSTESKFKVTDSALNTTNTTLGNINTNLDDFTFDDSKKLKVATAMDSFFEDLTNMPIDIKAANATVGVSNSNFSNITKLYLSGEQLKVTNSNFSNITPLNKTDDGYLKVEDRNAPSSTISGSVSVSNLPTAESATPLRVKITNASDIKSELSVDGDINVTIDTEGIKNAMISALHQDDDLTDNSANVRSVYGKLTQLYNLFNDGTGKIRVRNDVSGLPTIPVSTGYKLNNNLW